MSILLENPVAAHGVTAVESRWEPEAPEDVAPATGILTDDDLDFIGYSYPQLREMAREDCLMGRKALYPRSEVYMAKYISIAAKGKLGSYTAPVDASRFEYWGEQVIASEQDCF